MLIKLPITKNNKIIFDSFILDSNNNIIIINTLDNIKHRKMICMNYNSYKSIDIYFPLKFNVDNNIIFNELFFTLSLYYQKSTYNFIYLLENFIKDKINNKYSFVNFNNLKQMEYVYNKVNFNSKEYSTLEELIHYIFYKLNYYFNISLCISYLQYNNINIEISKKIISMINKINNEQILFYGIRDSFKNHKIYIQNGFDNIINKTEYFLSDNNKLLKVCIDNHDSNYIYLHDKKIKINKYNIKKYPEKFKKYITIQNLMYSVLEVIQYYNISDIIFKKNNKIINLCNYFKNNNFNNIVIDNSFNLKDDIYKKLTDEYYYCYNNYDFDTFKNIIDKNEYNEYNENIYQILINDYIYPFNYNKISFTENFKKIIYYFYKYNKEIEHMRGYHKLKIKYIHNSLLKLIENFKIKNYGITNYYKIYTDYIFLTIFNIIIDTNLLDLDNQYLTVIKNNYYKNMKGIIILHLLTWKSLNKKLNLYTYILNLKNQNNKLLFFENKVNMNIINSDIDNKIKKVIVDPLYLYNFFKKEKDFIKWTNILKNNTSLLYDNDIKIDNTEFKKIGKIIYILTKINNQDLENKEYSDYIRILKKYDHLILYNDRINLKIKNILKNTKINLGFLAKHIISENDSIVSLSPNSDNYDELNQKLALMTKRYFKYKGKYLGLKMSELSSNMNDI